MYFVIMSALLLCFIRGIDFMANEALSTTVVEIPTFAESGFSRLPEISTLDPDGNTAVADPTQNPDINNTTAPTVTTTTTEAVISSTDITEPIVTPSDVTEPDPSATGTTEPTVTTAPTIITTTTTATTLITTTQSNYAPVITTTTRYQTTTTTIRTTSRTTTRTTAPRTTATTQYYDSGNISFATYELSIYVNQSASNSVRIPIGGQKRVNFSSMTPSIVSVTALNDTTAYITGLASGTGWIQAQSLSGDVCYCKVRVIDFTDEVLRLTNEQRRMYGLPDLLDGSDLMDYVANVRLNEAMVYFSHTRPNQQRFEYAAIDAGLDYYRVGENLGCGQLTPQAVVTAWMNSPTHRANILDSGFTHLSVAYGIGPDGATYWVQFFWQPY